MRACARYPSGNEMDHGVDGIVRNLLAATVAIAISTAANVAAAEDWSTTITCTAALPAADDQLFLYASSSSQSETPAIQIRLVTSSVVLEADESVDAAKVEIAGQGSFTVPARGSKAGAKSVVTFDVPPEAKVLAAISRGHEATLSIPARGGEKSFAFKLAGSGAAVKHIARCLR